MWIKQNNAYKSMLCKFKGKRPSERPNHVLLDNITIVFRGLDFGNVNFMELSQRHKYTQVDMDSDTS
jgi:hypothetical protein